MRASTNVRQLSLNDGTDVALPQSGVVLVVGPNNAGKSQALRDISKLIRGGPSERGVVVQTAQIEFLGSGEELLETIEANRSVIRSTGEPDRVKLGESGRHVLSNASSWWTSAARGTVAAYFVLSADTESRLLASRPARSLNLYESDPEHPIHHLYVNRDVEARLDNISREAFSQGIILDTWSGGDHWSLRVGDIEPPNDPRPPQDYLDRLNRLPLLHEQGDGVRSLVGLLLDLFTGHQTVSLIDEPEAFLHPPQARYLAKVLSDDAAKSSTSTFLSTHSSDIVHGTLEGSAPTTVIRLVRHGDTNHAAVLENEAVRRLWSDPLLRYSNLLEGLFNDAVIVCESDADCKFFASMRDTLVPVDPTARQPDILFTSCGGKHRMHVAVEALRAASVPAAVIGDFDVLNDWAVLSRLITSAGGAAKKFESDWKVLNSALSSTGRTPSVAGLREAVNAALDKVVTISAKALEPVREALKIENGWDRVKNVGLAGVPKGDPHNAAVRLLDGLADLRIHLIRLGEMEDFVPTVGGHGPGWLSDVLEAGIHEEPATNGAREFYREVVASLIPTP